MTTRVYTYTATSYADLLTKTGLVGGDVAYTADTGYHWRWDALNSLWRNQGRFLATTAQMVLMTATNLAGCQLGDFGFATDTNQIGVYLGGTGAGAWSFLT
jgi:hypothetical protein